jgi:predicted RNase H-like HicB family nuclease
MMTTTHAYRDYVFRIDYRPEEPAYTVEFSDIPEIITSGDTLSEAFANACEALDLHLESLQKLGRPLPPCKHRLVVQAA